MSALGQELWFGGHIEKVRAVTHTQYKPKSTRSHPQSLGGRECMPKQRTVSNQKGSLPVVFRVRRMHTHKHLGCCQKSSEQAVFPPLFFQTHTHTHTYTRQNYWCKVVLACERIVIGCRVTSQRCFRSFFLFFLVVLCGNSSTSPPLMALPAS